MPWNGFRVAGLGILPERMLLALSAQYATSADGAGARAASSHYNQMLIRFGRHSPEGVVPPMFQNESDCLTKIGKAFFPRFPLAVGSWNLGAISDVPGIVPFHNRGEFVAHPVVF
jgi:hypothetical protein